MLLLTNKNFDKAYSKLPETVKVKFKQRRSIFLTDEFNVILNNHSLSGQYARFRSINITGDFRAIYYRLEQDTVIFVDIGTHNQLYGK
jgi:addiction module RelE/StbE family toxin